MKIMPKKVLTRRQLKAAEAKLRSDRKSVISCEPPKNNVAALPTMPLDAVQSNPEHSLATSEPQIVDVVKTEEKATVNIVVNDQKAKPKAVKKKLLVTETKVATPQPGPTKDQGSFSKTLTSKAAATITKIQKLSKAFKKKKNYKQAQTTTTNPAKLTADISLEETFDSLRYYEEHEEHEERKEQPSLGSRHRVWQLVEEKGHREPRITFKRIEQQQKPQASPEPDIKLLMSHELTMKSTNSVAQKAAAFKAHKITTSKENFLYALQQLKTPAAPVKLIGDTGYFVLTGTNDQLAAQFAQLARHNVLIRRCKLLLPGAIDTVVPQLEQLEANRQQILQRMHKKHELLAPRPQRRVNEPSKYH